MITIEGYSVCNTVLGYVIIKKNSRHYLRQNKEVLVFTTQDDALDKILDLIK